MGTKVVGRMMRRGWKGSRGGAGRWKGEFAEQLEPRVLLAAPIVAFGGQATFAVGAGPGAVAVGDFNRDGKLDVVTANTGDDSVSVLLGKGDGTFLSQMTFGVGSQPKAVVVADVNGDDKADLIVANFGDNSVGVLLGKGDGTFGPEVTFGAGVQPASVAVGDLNGDGKLDLAVANYGSAFVSVFTGSGDGSFSGEQTLGVSAGMSAVGIGDVNVDGKADVIATGGGFYLGYIYGGGANGTFLAPRTFFSNRAASVVVADVNMDGRPDIVLSGATDAEIRFVSIDRSGTVQNGGVDGGLYHIGLAAADVDVNGTPDLVTTGTVSNQIRVLPDAGMNLGTAPVTLAVAGSPGAVGLADLNSDGRPDVILAHPVDNSVGVLLGDAPPRLLSITRVNNADQYTSDFTLSFDVSFSKAVTGVDVPDFLPSASSATIGSMSVTRVSGSEYTVTLSAISGTGDVGLNFVDNGTVKDAAGNPLQPGGTASFQEPVYNRYTNGMIGVTCDFNGDGKPDLATPDYWLDVYLGNGNGTFAGPKTSAFGLAGSVTAMVAADLNGDATPDIVMVGFGTVSVYSGNGDGTFRPQETISLAGDMNELSLAAADMNGDGRADLIVSEYQNKAVGILLGNGDGTFQPQLTFDAGGQPQSLAVADVNRDGLQDVAVTNSGGSVGVLLGTGTGAILGPRLTYFVTYGRSVAVADLNADGIPDLALDVGTGVSVLFGNGDGTFESERTFAAFSGRMPVAAVDVNQDGKIDLLVPGGGRMSVLLGNGDGTFQPPTIVSLPVGLINVFLVSDLNGDARPDVIASSNFGPFAVVLNASNADLTGPTYSVYPNTDVVDYATTGGSLLISRDPDGQHLLVGGRTNLARLAISDPNGLTVNGDGKLDFISADSAGFPDVLHLNGTFEILPTDLSQPVLFPLAGKTMDIGNGTVYLWYGFSGKDPFGSIKACLAVGYNGGGWDGSPSASVGAVTSSAAVADPLRYAVGYSDWADGSGVNPVANSIELKFTLKGDANLDGRVDVTDLNRVLPDFNGVGDWVGGDFNYDRRVDIFDLNALLGNYNRVVGNQVTAEAVSAGAGLGGIGADAGVVLRRARRSGEVRLTKRWVI